MFTSAAFSFVVVDSSPGVSRFNYTLTLPNGTRVEPLGAPRVSQGSPSSTDPTRRTATLGLTGLVPDMSYTLSVWTLDQV